MGLKVTLLGMLVFLFAVPIELWSGVHIWHETKVEYSHNVEGAVVDQAGEPLIGVNIQVKGTNKGTSTDFDGRFVLEEIEEEAILVISYIGFVTQEVPVSGEDNLSITLVGDSQLLDEVVVVGYGKQKKVNLTGAVSTIKFDDVLENRPITNASQALGGAVPGLWVSQNSGRPGSDGAQIRVRGWGTLNNSNPLILIDGIEGSLGQINPNDIESITVLKDAASSAIYGSRAANGVVLVSLKSGQFEEGVMVNFSSYLGSQTLGRRYDLIDNSAEYMQMWNQALMNEGRSGIFPNELINDFENSNNSYLFPNTNFFDEVFRKGSIQEHNLSVNGGSEKSKYYVSFNYLDQEGIILNSNSKRYGLSINLESKLNNWLTAGGQFNGTKKVSSEPFDFNRILYIFANGGYPFTAPYTEDGRFGSVQALKEDGSIIVDQRNPLIEVANGLSENQNSFYKMNAFFNIQFAEDIFLKTSFTSQYTNGLINKYNQLQYGYTDGGLQTTNLNYGQILEASKNNVQTSYNTLFSTLNINKRFNGIHTINAVAGMQLETTTIENIFARRTDPAVAGLIQVDAGTSGIVANGNKNSLRLLSYFGRVNYSIYDKYLFEINLRADASSRFREGNRWGLFPAISAGWRVGEEDFIKDLDVFSNLKLRASWGQLGNQNIGSFWPFLTVIDQNNTLSHNFGGNLVPGAAVTSLVDENLSWETSSNFDVGLDLEILNNRLLIEMDYFNKTTSDIIVRLPIPLVLGGLQAPFENVGEMVNRGVEFNITFSKYNQSRNELGYKLGGNLTYVNNEVTKFRGGDSPDQLYLIREGFSYRTLYGYKSIGIYQSSAEAEEHMFANGYKPKAGELKYQDVNGDGRLDYQDKQDLGSTIPKVTFGFNSSLSLKGFELNVLLQGTANLNSYTNNSWTKPLGVSGGTITKRWRDAWTPENPDTDIPALKISNAWDNQASSFWVAKLSYVKLKNIQLGYECPTSFSNRIGVKKIYFYLNGQNILSLVNNDYEGFDPERSTFDTGENYYPIPRILSLGLNINL